MCKHCPRELGVKRYWYLPHWSGPNVAKTLNRYTTLRFHTPIITAEYDCGACDFIHVGLPFYKFKTPLNVENGIATHYSTCPDTEQIVYIRG